MFIKNIKLQHYKKFLKEDFIFNNGINLIKGLNETGKSTLAQALLTIWFGDTNSTSKKIKELTTWGEEEHLPILELDFVHNGNEYHLLKDFSSKKCELINKNSEEKYTSKKAQSQLNKLLGLET